MANGRTRGEIASDVDLDELAAYFTMALIGVAACIRAEAPPAEVKAACRVATGILDNGASSPQAQ